MKHKKGKQSTAKPPIDFNATAVLNASSNKIIKTYAWFIFLLSFLLYVLSVANGYALDDFIVIVKNKFTQKGFGGIGSILSKDTFAGMTQDNIMGLSGGRYRPLSVVTFAIEHQLFGNNPFISHLINVIINAFNCVLLFLLFLKFKTRIPAKAWINISLAATLLFVVMPAHTEPIINIKGRDDLMSLFFFLLASLQLFKYVSLKRKTNLYLSCLWLFLSLLSKEIAITFIAIFPLMMIFFTDASKSKIRASSILNLLVVIIFLAIRFFATKDNHGMATSELLNNPFLNTSSVEKYATIIYTGLLYFKLMIFPIHLSYDYNFNQIPLIGFGDWHVILSIIIHLCLFLIALVTFKSKSVYSFSILFYFITFSIVSNFFISVGTLFADRFVYIPSIGFCLLIVVAGYHLAEWLKKKINFSFAHKFLTGLLVVASILYLIRVTDRIGDWKDNNTLFLADVDDAPNSVKVQINASLAYMDLSGSKTGLDRDSMLNAAIVHLEKAISIYPTYATSYLNMGVVYSWMDDFPKAEYWWNKARVLDPNNFYLPEYDKVISTHYYGSGMKLGNENKPKDAISEFLKALKYDSANADLVFNLGGAYYTTLNFDSAYFYWKKTLEINPADERVKQAMMALPKNIK